MPVILSELYHRILDTINAMPEGDFAGTRVIIERITQGDDADQLTTVEVIQLHKRIGERMRAWSMAEVAATKEGGTH